MSKNENGGCGKKFETIWNFGEMITMTCGWKEDGFKPNYCPECEAKFASNNPNE